MLFKGTLALLVLISIVNSGNVYGSAGYQYSNVANGFNYQTQSNNLQYNNLPTSYIPNMPNSYIPNTLNNGLSSSSTQFGNFGVSAIPPTSAPVYVPAPLSGASSLSQSFTTSIPSFSSSSNSYIQGSGLTIVPTDYTVLTQNQDSSSASYGSYSVPSTTSSTFSASGSISNAGIVGPSSYSPYTTLGQISNVQPGSQVVTSTTSTQVVNSQNNLIQNVPSSPNPIKYEVTTVAKETPPIFFPSTVNS